MKIKNARNLNRQQMVAELQTHLPDHTIKLTSLKVIKIHKAATQCFVGLKKDTLTINAGSNMLHHPPLLILMILFMVVGGIMTFSVHPASMIILFLFIGIADLAVRPSSKKLAKIVAQILTKGGSDMPSNNQKKQAEVDSDSKRTVPSPQPQWDRKTTPISSRTVSLGRHPDNDVVISDPTVSGMHAHLEITNGIYIIVDKGSTNGTYVNGKKVINNQTLNKGDELRLANNIIQWEHL
jgi:hypothetical protein